jgi:hypothetical protein
VGNGAVVSVEENHKKFLSHLSDSDKARHIIAKYLIKRGHEVTIPPTSRAEKKSDWRKHADNGDLYIKQRIEVKMLGCHFTNKFDWPYKDKFIVCAKHSWDMANPKPYGYFLLNNKATHFAFVSNNTSSKWTSDVRKDSRYESVVQEFYFCPVELIIFGVIPSCP